MLGYVYLPSIVLESVVNNCPIDVTCDINLFLPQQCRWTWNRQIMHRLSLLIWLYWKIPPSVISSTPNHLFLNIVFFLAKLYIHQIQMHRVRRFCFLTFLLPRDLCLIDAPVFLHSVLSNRPQQKTCVFWHPTMSLIRKIFRYSMFIFRKKCCITREWANIDLRWDMPVIDMQGSPWCVLWWWPATVN